MCVSQNRLACVPTSTARTRCLALLPPKEDHKEDHKARVDQHTTDQRDFLAPAERPVPACLVVR